VIAHEASHALPARAESVVLARRAVEAMALDPGRRGAVKLLVSELVTNAIEHARLQPDDRIELVARLRVDGSLRVEVRDPGRGVRDHAARGLGMRIVDRVADRWGVDRRNGLTCVWFELDRAGR
jgi:anti-sigma regulatory factor (Ser/Thr protein kinase)